MQAARPDPRGTKYAVRTPTGFVTPVQRPRLRPGLFSVHGAVAVLVLLAALPVTRIAPGRLRSGPADRRPPAGGCVGCVCGGVLGWQHDRVTSPPRNLVAPADLWPRDVDDALARIAARDPALARRAVDAFEGLTWGEGPGVLRQAGLQEWLWYDDFALHELRVWLQQAGALRKRKDRLLRTSAGAAMAADPAAAWDRLGRHLVPSGWDGFVAETAMLMLVGLGGEVLHQDMLEFVVSAAAAAGWATTVGRERQAPQTHDVAWSLGGSLRLWRLFSLTVESGDWQERRLALSDVGTAAVLTSLRHAAAGPRDSL